MPVLYYAVQYWRLYRGVTAADGSCSMCTTPSTFVVYPLVLVWPAAWLMAMLGCGGGWL
jgi:hypothetical protein